MSIYKADARHRVKRSILTGVVPTGREGDFTDGTWLNTEIRAGERVSNCRKRRTDSTNCGIQSRYPDFKRR